MPRETRKENLKKSKKNRLMPGSLKMMYLLKKVHLVIILHLFSSMHVALQILCVLHTTPKQTLITTL